MFLSASDWEDSHRSSATCRTHTTIRTRAHAESKRNHENRQENQNHPCFGPPRVSGTSSCFPGSGPVQPGSLPLEKDPSCLVLTSLSCSSCRWPRRYRYSMCITSVFLMREFSLNSSRILGMKPGFSFPARRNCRYRALRFTCCQFKLCTGGSRILQPQFLKLRLYISS
uniref:Uncharacterized protein n=1 Tax=Cyprinodon variegatus TaxID=28743 RepID=A0A3Q2CMM3_CYPVA